MVTFYKGATMSHPSHTSASETSLTRRQVQILPVHCLLHISLELAPPCRMMALMRRRRLTTQDFRRPNAREYMESTRGLHSNLKEYG